MSHTWQRIRPKRKKRLGESRPSEYRCTVCGLESIEDELGVIYSESVRDKNGSIKVVVASPEGAILELDCAEFAAFRVTTI